MSNDVQYIGGSTVDTSRGRSSFWADCPIAELMSGFREGHHVFNEFNTAAKITNPTTEAALVGLPLNGFAGGTAGTNITLGQVRNAHGEVILSSTTANEGAVLRDLSCPFVLSAGTGKLWFESNHPTAISRRHTPGNCVHGSRSQKCGIRHETMAGGDQVCRISGMRSARARVMTFR